MNGSPAATSRLLYYSCHVALLPYDSRKVKTIYTDGIRVPTSAKHEVSQRCAANQHQRLV